MDNGTTIGSTIGTVLLLGMIGLCFGGLIVMGVVGALSAVPVRHVRAQVSGFRWRTKVVIGTPVWEHMTSDFNPGGGEEIRNVSGSYFYQYERRRWHKVRSAAARGEDRDGWTMPGYTLGPDEEVKRQSLKYLVAFGSPRGKRYTAGVKEDLWRSLDMAASCRLSLSVIGRITKVVPERSLEEQRS